MDSSSRPIHFEDLENYDMKVIKGIHWAETMYKTLETGFKKSFFVWIKHILALSQNEEDIKEWRSTFIEQFEERCCELVADVQDLHEQVVVNIETYLNRVQILCKTLHIEMPVIGQPNLGLYQEQLQIKKKIIELEKIIESRQEELKQLRRKQIKACQRLGIDPKIIPENPLPSSKEIMDIQKHVEQLENEVFEREEAFYNIKIRLTQVIGELGYITNTQFEKDVIFGEKPLPVTESNMQALENFQKKILKECTCVRDEISQLTSQIEHIWTLLDVDFIEREQFRNKCNGSALENLNLLRVEFDRCKELKKANIKIFIDRLRRELVEVWDHCLCSQSARDEFIFFYSDCYTEDLIELHEDQLIKWKFYAEQNKEILSLLAKHKNLWYRMTELEQSAAGPDRFNNRGGKLLKEERERNLLAKQIPKIEEEMLHLAERYSVQQEDEFLINGQRVQEYICNLHAERDNMKKLKLSARKAQKEATFMGRMAGSNLFPASASIKRDAVTTIKKVKPPPRRILTDPRRRSKGLTPKIYVTDSSGTTHKRLSFEQKKKKIRKEHVINTTYTEFQDDLTKRNDLRSTMNIQEEDLSSPTLAKPLPATPIPNGITTLQSRMTPKTAISSVRTPRPRNKLTVAKNSKMINF